MTQHTLWVITGPTAVGKTALTVAFAKEREIPIVSCDSRQFYQELSIGTAKPTKSEMDGVPHHFINSHSLSSPLSAASYEVEAVETITTLFETHSDVILTGGSGLYLQVVLEGIDEMPKIPEEVKNALQSDLEIKGLDALVDELQDRDPVYAQHADLNNARRVLRALEVIRASGQTFSSFRKSEKLQRPWNTKLIILNREREELYHRIDQRVDIMLDQGLLHEAKSVASFKDEAVLRTVGYQELYPYFDGEYDLDRATELIKRNSRRYAKRQLTWFRRMENATWMTPKEFEAKYLNLSES